MTKTLWSVLLAMIAFGIYWYSLQTLNENYVTYPVCQGEDWPIDTPCVTVDREHLVLEANESSDVYRAVKIK